MNTVRSEFTSPSKKEHFQNLKQNYSATEANFNKNESLSLSSKGDWSFHLVEEKLSRYNILFPLGRGSSSFVYKAIDVKTNEFRVTAFFTFSIKLIKYFKKEFPEVPLV